MPTDKFAGEVPDPDEEFEDRVPVSTYLEMTARLLGRIHALEATIIAMLARRDDLPDIARHADAILVSDESSRIAANGTDEETIKSHEWGRQSLEAIIGNTMLARRMG